MKKPRSANTAGLLHDLCLMDGSTSIPPTAQIQQPTQPDQGDSATSTASAWVNRNAESAMSWNTRAVLPAGSWQSGDKGKGDEDIGVRLGIS